MRKDDEKKHSKEYLDSLHVIENPQDYDSRDVVIAKSYVRAYLDGYNQANSMIHDAALSAIRKLNKQLKGNMGHIGVATAIIVMAFEELGVKIDPNKSTE